MIRSTEQATSSTPEKDASLTTLAQNLLVACKRGDPTEQYSSKYGSGHLPKINVTTFERRYRLHDCDPRIHFALDCGARSCPPIRAYEPGRIDEQLDPATRRYLDATVEYDPKTGVAHVPPVFLWFRGDFGGGLGVREFLREHGAVPDDATPKLRHLSWDWSGGHREGRGGGTDPPFDRACLGRTTLDSSRTAGEPRMDESEDSRIGTDDTTDLLERS